MSVNGFEALRSKKLPCDFPRSDSDDSGFIPDMSN